MAFESFAAFLQMGSHGLYVWLSYGFFTLCLTGLLYSLFSENRKLKQELLKEGLIK